MIRVTRFGADGSVTCGAEELLSAEVPAEGSIWIDLEGPDPRFEPFLRQCGFHPLAIEDTYTQQHQPKVEEYGDTLFVIVRGIDFNVPDETGEDGDLATLKLAAFLSKGRLVTAHRAPLRSLNAVYARIRDAHHSFPGGVTQALWTVCDELIDLYLPVVEGIGDEIEELEERVLEEPEREHLQQILGLRRKLATLRRTMLPHRQVFSHLASSRFGPIDDTAALNFRDTQDNVLRMTDAIEQHRDMLSNLKDTYLSVVAQKTNDVMRVLTVFSAIVLPLSLIAGVYGMNFEFMPELHERWGYFAVLGGMASIAVGMLFWFRRKNWL